MTDKSQDHRSARSASRALFRWLMNSEAWKSLFTVFTDCQNPGQMMRREPREGVILGPSEPDAAPNYLGRCCEQAADAYTVEDAIFWHCEIINELAVQMHEAQSKPWPNSAKATVINALEERQDYHAKAVLRLTGVMRRNEQLVWPGSTD